jgi:hypothetical protein
LLEENYNLKKKEIAEIQKKNKTKEEDYRNLIVRFFFRFPSI